MFMRASLRFLWWLSSNPTLFNIAFNKQIPSPLTLFILKSYLFMLLIFWCWICSLIFLLSFWYLFSKICPIFLWLLFSNFCPIFLLNLFKCICFSIFCSLISCLYPLYTCLHKELFFYNNCNQIHNVLLGWFFS